ncbi:hypothetical protein UNPF46_08555 [Bradyrhizobium sp. UNPF46]|nr:hypothetical protein UNPF46_08555 [Bradyrhizobium sp. UNPF46]
MPQPTFTPVPAPPPIPSLDSIYNTPATPLETQVNDTAKAAGDTNAALAGETAFRTSQEQNSDIAGKKQTVNDLTTQFNNLKAEADQIPLSIQKSFEGRDATVGGVAPIQTSLLRNNSIRQLGVSAMLNAANGNLATAQDQVDSAVKAKFDPLRAELAAKKAQLDAITPLLDIEQKKTAAKQAAALADRARALDKQEADQKTIYSTMLAAAQNGADSLTLRNIQNATTPDEAIAAAGDSLVSPKTQVINANGRVLLVDSKTGKTVVDLGTSDAALKVANAAQKPATVTQLTYGNYAPRLQSADTTINSLSGTITNMSPVSFAIANRLPSWLQSSEVQQYNQAKLNFVNAVLRQESGAAISDSERKQYEAQYFPVPGDSPATIAQKAQNRAQVVQSYVKNAGPAYTGPANDPYADYRTQLQNGEILVQRGSQLVAITQDELRAGDLQL